MKRPKGRRLKPGVDYKQVLSVAKYVVSCQCGFSTDVPEAGSGEEAEARVAERHRCASPSFLWEAPFVCENCDEAMRHCDLGNIKVNGIHLAVCDECRIGLATGKKKAG